MTTTYEPHAVRTLLTFVDTYCRERHTFRDRVLAVEPELNGRPLFLCPECNRLLQKILESREVCSVDDAGDCLRCADPCLPAECVGKLREISHFSGRHLALRGNPQFLWRVLF